METGDQAVMIESDGPCLPLADLVARARAGDVQSFEELMILHQRYVFRSAYRILGHVEDAQDAAQEVFFRLYKYLHRFDTSKSLTPWLYKMTVNVCHDIARKRQYTIDTNQINEQLVAAVDESIDLTAERKTMALALKTLSEKERAAIVLRDIEGLSTREVAQILGSTETTVRSQISRARIKLKEYRDRILRRQS
jgi:RNA polymerase sigma-70 factor (ECF subfamily)